MSLHKLTNFSICQKHKIYIIALGVFLTISASIISMIISGITLDVLSLDQSHDPRLIISNIISFILLGGILIITLKSHFVKNCPDCAKNYT